MQSVLYGTGGHAGCHVSLGEDEQERRWDGRDHGGGHDLVPLGGVVPDVVVDPKGDRDELRVPSQGRCEDEVRPSPEEGEERHGDDRVPAQWKHDRGEGSPGASAVDARGLHELAREPGHEGAEQERSEEHTSDSSHVASSYAVFCLKKKSK